MSYLNGFIDKICVDEESEEDADLWYPQNRFGPTVQYLNINQGLTKNEALDPQENGFENRNFTSTASINPNIGKNPSESFGNMKLEDSSLLISNLYKQECEDKSVVPTKCEEEHGSENVGGKRFLIKNEDISESMMLCEKNWKIENVQKVTTKSCDRILPQKNI